MQDPHERNVGSSGLRGVMQTRVGSNLHILMIPPFYYHKVKLTLRSEIKFIDTLSVKPTGNHFKSLSRTRALLKALGHGFSNLTLSTSGTR